MNNIYLIIVAMAIVTYLPRMLPMVLFSKFDLPDFIKRVLTFIPYTALSALIFPDILFSTASIESALAGTAMALITAYFKLNLFLVVSSGIIAVLIYELFILSL